MFLQGTGDVLISYENEAINTERQGKPVEHINPPQTFKIENPVAVVTSSAHLDKATALKNFLFTTEGQKIWAQAGFRPVDPSVAADFAERLPDAAEAVDHRRPRWMERGRSGVVRQGQRHHHQDLQAGHWMTAASTRIPRRPGPNSPATVRPGRPAASSRAATAARRCGSARRRLWLSRHRAAAAGRDRVAVRRRRLARVLGCGDVERGDRVVPGDADDLDRVSR